jgi:DNA-binding response OmpR family regulator
MTLGLSRSKRQGRRQPSLERDRLQSESQVSPGGLQLRQKKILLVEDDEDIQRFVSRLMQLEGADLTVCSNAEDGEARILVEHFDLVLLDVNLPGRTGWDLLEGARKLHAEYPIVVFTASVNPEYEQKAFGLGATGFITKPVGARELVDRLKSYLDS